MFVPINSLSVYRYIYIYIVLIIALVLGFFAIVFEVVWFLCPCFSLSTFRLLPLLADVRADDA